jgi:hypothetical protein
MGAHLVPPGSPRPFFLPRYLTRSTSATRKRRNHNLAPDKGADRRFHLFKLTEVLHRPGRRGPILLQSSGRSPNHQSSSWAGLVNSRLHALHTRRTISSSTSSIVALAIKKLMHHFWGNILVPQCVIFNGTGGTGPQSKLVWLITRAGDELQSSR